MQGHSATQLSANTVKVHWVGRDQVGDVIKAFGYYLLRGLSAADLPLAWAVEALVTQDVWLGVAYRAEPFEPLGVWLSDLREQDGTEFATVYALAGAKLPLWMPDIEALVVDLARRNQCQSVRFFGRQAYTMLVRDLEIIGTGADGRTLLFEKKL